MSPLSGHPLTGHSLSGQNIFPVLRTVRKTGIRLTGNYYLRFIIRTTRCPDNEDPDNGDWSWVPVNWTVRITETECTCFSIIFALIADSWKCVTYLYFDTCNCTESLMNKCKLLPANICDPVFFECLALRRLHEVRHRPCAAVLHDQPELQMNNVRF